MSCCLLFFSKSPGSYDLICPSPSSNTCGWAKHLTHKQKCFRDLVGRFPLPARAARLGVSVAPPHLAASSFTSRDGTGHSPPRILTLPLQAFIKELSVSRLQHAPHGIEALPNSCGANLKPPTHVWSGPICPCVHPRFST